MGKRKHIATPETIASDLLACKKSFDNVGIPWIIMGGIVLGYARYEKIMEWDTDIDVAVFVELTPKQRQILNKSLDANGFKIGKNKTDFLCGYRKSSYNIWFFHKNGDYCEAFPKSTPGLKFVEKSMWYEDPQIVDFLDDKYPMPNHMEDYLICQYGLDWMTNIVKDHEKYYLDKRGTRKVSEWPAGRATKDGDMWPKLLRIGDNM
jgi:hypothetical protein